jgi:tetratricopeptide (TPR) repeat protein
MLDQAQAAYQARNLHQSIALYQRLFDRVGRLSERIFDRRPELRDMHRQAGMDLVNLLGLEGRYAEAIEVTEELARRYPGETDAWRRDLAMLRLAKGEADRGLSELEALADEEPEDVWNWIVLASESRIEGRFAESDAALDRALDVAASADPEVVAEVHYQRFQLLKDMGQIDDAIAAWEQAVAVHSDVAGQVRDVYVLLTEAGRYAEALAYVERDGNQLQAGFQRGLIRSLTGDPDGARQEWQAVAAMDPEKFESGHDAWAEAVLRLGDPVPALEGLQRLLGSHASIRLLALSGIAWAMHGDQEAALSLLERTTELMQRSRPPKKKLDSADWRLLDSLVSDEEMKAALRPNFAVVETLWG